MKTRAAKQLVSEKEERGKRHCVKPLNKGATRRGENIRVKKERGHRKWKKALRNSES